jgi:copper resistance protein B
MQNMDEAMDKMQGGSPPPNARDPHAYSDGLELGPMPGMDMADDEAYYRILTEELEYFNSNEGNGIQIDGQAWIGGDFNKLWLEFEGGRENGNTSATRTEILWDRTFATYWSTQLGVRNDSNEGPGRDWLAFGVQGTAPYWFEVEAWLI